MAYNTLYELTVFNDEGELEEELIVEHEEGISKISGYDQEIGYLQMEEAVSWYDYEDDMLLYSTQHPDLVFKLQGEGEENLDLWLCYFHNGKMQRCEAKVVYPPFDPAQLI